MNRYAKIVSGRVDVIVEQESTPIIEGPWVEITDQNVGPNDFYDGENFTKYVAPPEPVNISKADFRFRFTDTEYVAILSAAKTDVEVQAWYETFNMLSSIDLRSTRTKEWVQVLVNKNLISQIRADEILVIS